MDNYGKLQHLQQVVAVPIIMQRLHLVVHYASFIFYRYLILYIDSYRNENGLSWNDKRELLTQTVGLDSTNNLLEISGAEERGILHNTIKEISTSRNSKIHIHWCVFSNITCKFASAPLKLHTTDIWCMTCKLSRVDNLHLARISRHQTLRIVKRASGRIPSSNGKLVGKLRS